MSGAVPFNPLALGRPVGAPDQADQANPVLGDLGFSGTMERVGVPAEKPPSDPVGPLTSAQAVQPLVGPTPKAPVSYTGIVARLQSLREGSPDYQEWQTALNRTNA